LDYFLAGNFTTRKIPVGPSERDESSTKDIRNQKYKFRCPRDARLRSNVFAAEK
jgi:hypothetical protein